uniref:Uncharacterized protein n=1 Tax=Sphaerodactylus townsendi TaxID=933632 RepID=A0ACB8EXH1_9SAUR
MGYLSDSTLSCQEHETSRGGQQCPPKTTQQQEKEKGATSSFHATIPRCRNSADLAQELTLALSLQSRAKVSQFLFVFAKIKIRHKTMKPRRREPSLSSISTNELTDRTAGTVF